MDGFSGERVVYGHETKRGKRGAVITTAIMLPRIGEVRIAAPLKIAVIILLTVLVLFLRRPGQFSHPYLWVEDGTDTLKSFADHGAYILIEPLNGYEVLATKILSYIAFRSSILWAPEIEVVLAILATCAVPVS